jgi:hypothetical protein
MVQIPMAMLRNRAISFSWLTASLLDAFPGKSAK